MNKFRIVLFYFLIILTINSTNVIAEKASIYGLPNNISRTSWGACNMVGSISNNNSINMIFDCSFNNESITLFSAYGNLTYQGKNYYFDSIGTTSKEQSSDYPHYSVYANILLYSNNTSEIIPGILRISYQNTSSEIYAGGSIMLYDDNRIDEHQNLLIGLISWMSIIDSTVSTILDSISPILIKNEHQDIRLDTIENNLVNVTTINGTLPNYFKYMSSGDKKILLCGYMLSNDKIANYVDLGLNCTSTYRTSNSGRVSQSCRCN